MTTLDQLWQAPNLRELLDEAERKWQDEQRRRHQFWADIDENLKAEAIPGFQISVKDIFPQQPTCSAVGSRRQ